MKDDSEVSPSEEEIEVSEVTEGTEGTSDPYEGKSQQDIEDEMNGQLRLDF